MRNLSQKEAESVIAQIQYVQALIEALQGEIEKLNMSFSQISTTINGLRELRKRDEILTSIGSGVYMYSKVTYIDTFLLNVGANIYVEKSREETIKYLEKQLKNISDLAQRYRQQITGYLNVLNELNRRLKVLQSESQG